MPPITSLLNIDGFELEDISGLDPITFKLRFTQPALFTQVCTRYNRFKCIAEVKA